MTPPLRTRLAFHGAVMWSLVVAVAGHEISSVLGAGAGVRGLAVAGPPAYLATSLLFWIAIGGFGLLTATWTSARNARD